MEPTSCAALPYDVEGGFELAPVERLFCELVAIDAPSLSERAMADRVRSELERIGFYVTEDSTAGADDGMVTALTQSRRVTRSLEGMIPGGLRSLRLLHTGSNAGNLFASIGGAGEPILFLVHLDTVQPAHGKRAVVRADGRIESVGNTVLGADCLGGVAAVLAAVERLEAEGVVHRPVELACMVAEEIGNVGARAFDFGRVQAPLSYTLDYAADPNCYAYQAPTIIYITADVAGRAAHAGFEPEKGVSAIKIAAEAIDHIDVGRIDAETTANVGLISGGRGTNIVPSTCIVRAEVRSYNHAKAVEQAEHMKSLFEAAARAEGGAVEVTLTEACRAYRIDASSPVVRHFERACASLGMEAQGASTFGGSDNNIAVACGIPGIVIANGMRLPHSTREYVEPGDLRRIQELVEALLTEGLDAQNGTDYLADSFRLARTAQ
jgi:tripeptide aminopeptidase